MNLFNRFYNDYIMPNRYDEYEKMIIDYINSGYEFIMIKDYPKLKNSSKHIIIRHDIDSDVKIAKKMFEIEKKYNIKTTYYFRWKTFDKEFIKEISSYGSEVGYHYEEVADYIKKHSIRDRDEVIKLIPEIRKQLIQNIEKFKKDSDIEIKSIAAHGDFVNIKFDIYNNILFNAYVGEKTNLIEAYDSNIENNLTARINDCTYPKYWEPISPSDAITKGSKNVLLLIHTRWWNRNPRERFVLDIERILKK